jgi:hypothetical protein
MVASWWFGDVVGALSHSFGLGYLHGADHPLLPPIVSLLAEAFVIGTGHTSLVPFTLVIGVVGCVLGTLFSRQSGAPDRVLVVAVQVIAYFGCRGFAGDVAFTGFPRGAMFMLGVLTLGFLCLRALGERKAVPLALSFVASHLSALLLYSFAPNYWAQHLPASNGGVVVAGCAVVLALMSAVVGIDLLLSKI